MYKSEARKKNFKRWQICKILKITIPYVSQIARKKLVDIIVDGILSVLPAFIDNIIGYRAVLRLSFGIFSLSKL